MAFLSKPTHPTVAASAVCSCCRSKLSKCCWKAIVSSAVPGGMVFPGGGGTAQPTGTSVGSVKERFSKLGEAASS